MTFGRFNGADRVRASKLRKKIDAGEKVAQDDQTWYQDYEQAKRGHRTKSDMLDPPDPSINASVAEKITYTEERSAAQGNHPNPVAYEGMVRAEGLRADTLLRIVADALCRVNSDYMTMNAHLLARTTAIEEAHVAMLHEVREHFLARVNAEAEASQMRSMLESGENGEESQLAQLVGLVIQAQQNQAQATQLGEAKQSKKKKAKVKPLGGL
jgi:hypothetical protein